MLSKYGQTMLSPTEVANGAIYLSVGFSRALVGYHLHRDRPGADWLTDWEQQVLQFVAEG